MRIYCTHSQDFDYEEEFYDPIRRSHLFNKHEFIFPHEKGKPRQRSKEIILTCGAMIAEVSYLATGEGIEMGWADDANIPIIAIYKKGYEVSGSISEVTKVFVKYSSEAEMISGIDEKIKEI